MVRAQSYKYTSSLSHVSPPIPHHVVGQSVNQSPAISSAHPWDQCTHPRSHTPRHTHSLHKPPCHCQLSTKSPSNWPRDVFFLEKWDIRGGRVTTSGTRDQPCSGRARFAGSSVRIYTQHWRCRHDDQDVCASERRDQCTVAGYTQGALLYYPCTAWVGGGLIQPLYITLGSWWGWGENILWWDGWRTDKCAFYDESL